MAKNHKLRNVAIGAVALLAVYVIFVNPDILESSNIPTPAKVDNTPVADDTKTNVYNGPISISFPSSDALDSSISYGEDTELNIILYRLESDGSYKRLGVPTSAEVGVATVTSSADLKTVYAEFSVASGQDYIVKPDSMTSNGRSAGANQWLDLNNDGRPTWVSPIDITGFPTNPAITPAFNFYVELIDEGTFTLDSPANVDVTDTGKQRCNIKWSIDSSASGDGIAVSRIRMTWNSTTTGEWYPLDTNISFPTGSDPNSPKQKIFLSEFVPTELASTYRYDYVFGNGDVKDAHLLLSPLNGETNFEIPVEAWVNMDTVGTGAELTLAIQTVDVFGNTSETTDAVVCN